MNQEQNKLLMHISAVSFAAYDTMLYLDTHPDCMEAKDYYCQMMEERTKAIMEYEKNYEPLLAMGDCNCMKESKNWLWATTPWPWERRHC